MSVEDAGELLEKLHPELALITHMGVIMIEAGPDKFAKMISTDQTRVVAGEDGMVVNLDTLEVYREIPAAVPASVFRIVR